MLGGWSRECGQYWTVVREAVPIVHSFISPNLFNKILIRRGSDGCGICLTHPASGGTEMDMATALFSKVIQQFFIAQDIHQEITMITYPREVST